MEMDSSERDYSWTFTTANIIDYELLCLQTVYFKSPSIKEALRSLEAFTKECKLIADRNGVDYDIYSHLHFLKEMVLTIPFETVFLDLLVHIKYSLYKSKFFDNFKNILMNKYIHHIEKYLLTSIKASTDPDGEIVLTSQVETIVKKILRVFHVLKLDPELSFENLVQYEFLADLLEVCHSVNVQDSQLVVSLLKLTIDRYTSESCGVLFVRHPRYPHEFFEYILKHVMRVKFDLIHYYSTHSRTLWEYARNFSVVSAASFGKVDKVLCLLQHGFDIFPDSEAWQSGHCYPHIKEIMSPTNRMVLQIMYRMRQVNCFTSDFAQPPENGYYIATPNQEDCFRLIWRALPEPYVRHSQLALDISTEYFYLALHAIFKPSRHNKNLKLADMYEACFEDMAVGPHEPRTLKHLCRCTIRRRLHQTWSLPNGVFHLGLPKSLEKYLNLEYE